MNLADSFNQAGLDETTVKNLQELRASVYQAIKTHREESESESKDFLAPTDLGAIQRREKNIVTSLNNYLQAARFHGVRPNLNEIDLVKLTLCDINFTGADMIGANLSGSYVVDAILVDVDLTSAKLSLTKFNSSKIIRCDLSGAKLLNTKFTDGTVLCDINFTGAYMDGVDLTTPRSVANLDVTGTSGEITIEKKLFKDTTPPHLKGQRQFISGPVPKI